MHWIRVAISVVVLFAVLLVATQFALVNSDPVTVRYFVGSSTAPLSLVVVCAFATGLLIASLVGWLMATRWRWKARRLNRTAEQCRQELAELRDSMRRLKSSP